MTRSNHQECRLLIVVGFFVAAAGCSDDLPLTIPVSGRLTFDGGPMPGHGYVAFTPLQPAPGYSRRPARSLFTENGEFEATSWEQGDGLVPGTYFIRIDCWEVKPTMDRPVGKSFVPARYGDRATSPIKEIVIEADSGSIDLGVINIESN